MLHVMLVLHLSPFRVSLHFLFVFFFPVIPFYLKCLLRQLIHLVVHNQDRHVGAVYTSSPFLFIYLFNVLPCHIPPPSMCGIQILSFSPHCALVT